MTAIININKILVKAPLQKVFEFVSDLKKHPEWSYGELKVKEEEPGPIEVGKEYRSLGQVGPQKDRPNKVQVNLYRPPHQFGFVATDPLFGKVIHLFTFIEQDGGTLVERRVTLNINPMLAFIFRLFIYPMVGNPQMEKTLAKLKAKLEENTT